MSKMSQRLTVTEHCISRSSDVGNSKQTVLLRFHRVCSSKFHLWSYCRLGWIPEICLGRNVEAFKGPNSCHQIHTKHKKLKAHTPSLTHLTALFPGLPGRASTRMPFLLPNQQRQSTEDKNNPPTTAAVSRPLYGSTCVSRHLQ